jgi:hypothetical protein
MYCDGDLDKFLEITKGANDVGNNVNLNISGNSIDVSNPNLHIHNPDINIPNS